MLDNQKIYEILHAEKKGILGFAKYLNMSHQALVFRLKSKDRKNNLDGMYREYLVKQQLLKD